MKRRAITLGLLLILTLAGCGGAGLISGLPFTRSKDSLLRLTLTALNAHSANRALESLSGRFGGFSHLGRDSDPGDPAEPHDPESPYFDEWLGLWAVSSSVESGFTTTYYLDAALTQSAGHSTSTWQETADHYSGTTSVSITGGSSAGYTLQSEYSYSNLTGAGTYTSQIVHPEYGNSEDTGTWNEDGSGAYRSRWSKGNEFYEYVGQYTSDGAWSNSSSNSDGFIFTLIGNADGSGTGAMTGPDLLLPATIAWDILGHGTITWADKTITEFEYFGVAGEDPGDVEGSGPGMPGEGNGS
ncbi:MAG: hypothetical protein KF812_09915 [Fimbriimonadaceae bacterium]|nr:hypothetical protein [Fimbriimonadaceae bacterium]